MKPVHVLLPFIRLSFLFVQHVMLYFSSPAKSRSKHNGSDGRPVTNELFLSNMVYMAASASVGALFTQVQSKFEANLDVDKKR